MHQDCAIFMLIFTNEPSWDSTTDGVLRSAMDNDKTKLASQILEMKTWPRASQTGVNAIRIRIFSDEDAQEFVVV